MLIVPYCTGNWSNILPNLLIVFITNLQYGTYHFVKVKHRSTYTEEDMIEAVRLVKEEYYTIKRAAATINSSKKNDVPRMTLSNRINNQDPARKPLLGRPVELWRPRWSSALTNVTITPFHNHAINHREEVKGKLDTALDMN